MDEAQSSHCAFWPGHEKPAPRPATDEEEAWLQRGEEILHRYVESMESLSSPSPSLDAEVFDQEKELAQWMNAEQEVSAIKEAEFVYRLEEENEQELAELAFAEDVHRHLMMKSLLDGATFLIDYNALEEMDLQALVLLQQSATELLQLVNEAVHSRMEEGRLRAINLCNKAFRLQKETETMAAHERTRLRADISKLRRDCRDLNERLEQEKDRTTCRICFTKPKDVLPLPCLHFDYCSACLQRYQKIRNICPTCRIPISGVLRHNLSVY